MTPVFGPTHNKTGSLYNHCRLPVVLAVKQPRLALAAFFFEIADFVGVLQGQADFIQTV